MRYIQDSRFEVSQERTWNLEDAMESPCWG